MVREISPAEFAVSWPGASATTLLDVREAWELAIVGLPGALHIPMGEIPDRLAEIDPTHTIVVLCHGGVRSLRVAQFLAAKGYPSVANLTGGISAWQRDVDPSLTSY